MVRFSAWRKFLLPRLRRGEITITQAAWIAGASRQAVMQWCDAAGLRWKEAEHARIMKIRAAGERWMRRELGISGPRRRKAELRREANNAKRQWDQKQADAMDDWHGED